MAQQVGSAGVAEQIQTPDILRVGGTLGAEVSGIDLSKPISPAAFGALNDALLDHKVLFFRDQNITPEQHIALGKIFGEVTVHPFVPHLPDKARRTGASRIRSGPCVVGCRAFSVPQVQGNAR